MKLNAGDIYDGSIPAESFENEKKNFLPEMSKFESCKKSEGCVDKYSTVTVAQNRYSVPDILVGKHVDIRTYTDKIIIYHGGEIVARHERSFKRHDWKIDIYHYLHTLKRKPGVRLKHCIASVGHPNQKYDLVIADELGYISFDRWNEVFGDAAITSALVDRLT